MPPSGGAAIARLALAALAALALVLAASATALGSGSGVTVAPGDTLSGIAARHGTTMAALARANGIANPHVIRAGQRLLIPAATAAPAAGGGQATPSGAGGAYRVRPGDTLSAIAARAGTTPATIAALNGIANPNLIVAGRTLRLPGPAAPPPPPAPVRLVASSPGGDVAGLISASAARHGVDPALARAVAWQESGFSQSAVSSAGAVGVMQLLPGTARWFGPAVLGRRIDPNDLQDNIDAGVAYLAWLQRQAGGTSGALAAYYQGLSALRRDGPYPGTREYVANVMANVGRV